MIARIVCQSCKKPLSISCSEFDGKAMFISLHIKRFYEMCKECAHMRDTVHEPHFCSVKCLKEWIFFELDKFIEDRVMGITRHLEQE